MYICTYGLYMVYIYIWYMYIYGVYIYIFNFMYTYIYVFIIIYNYIYMVYIYIYLQVYIYIHGIYLYIYTHMYYWRMDYNTDYNPQILQDGAKHIAERLKSIHDREGARVHRESHGRWCPRSFAKLMSISPISLWFMDVYGRYIYIYRTTYYGL